MSELTKKQIYNKEYHAKNKDLINERKRLNRLKKKNEIEKVINTEKKKEKEEVVEEKFFDSKEVAQAKYDAIRKKRSEYQKQYRLKKKNIR